MQFSYALGVHNLLIAIPLFSSNLINPTKFQVSWHSVMPLKLKVEFHSCPNMVVTHFSKTVEGLKIPLRHPLPHPVVMCKNSLISASPALSDMNTRIWGVWSQFLTKVWACTVWQARFRTMSSFRLKVHIVTTLRFGGGGMWRLKLKKDTVEAYEM